MNGIPRIIHRVAIGTPPDEYETFWQGWQTLHPGWEFHSWDGTENEQWELAEFHERASCPSQLSDLLRWEIIWKYGGIYTDWDVEPFKPFTPFLQHDFFVGTEDRIYISPGLFGAIPRHPAVRACIDWLKLGKWNEHPPTTGPDMATGVLKRRDDVTVVDSPLFYPYHHDQMWMKNLEFPRAYSAHHWGQSWKSE